MSQWRIGVDVGGTFTDFSLLNVDTGELLVDKVMTTPADPALGIVEGLATLEARGIPGAEIVSFLHGTTITTNALIERKGARIGLLLTAGLRGIVEVQSGDRHGNTYNLAWEKPDTLAPPELIFEIPERCDARGGVILDLDEQAVRAVARQLAGAEPQAVAVCYLFSYANPEHEVRTRQILEKEMPGVFVSLSSAILPRIREWPRMSSTLLNAYLEPALVRYLRSLRNQLGRRGVTTDQLFLMQSNGGVMPFEAVLTGGSTIHTIFSGPAGGVRAGARVAGAAGIERAVTMDIGGTSCDISFIEAGKALEITEGEVSEYPVAVPMIDITTIGAGGGTIAWIDRGGGLNLGPMSAGADPGPVCYGRGGQDVTVTDANLVLGCLNPDYFLGGRVHLDAQTASRAIKERVAVPLGLSVSQAALAIVQIIDVRMADRIRVLASQRALALSEFTLMAGGGAGPVHATRVADELGIRSVLIPPSPGTFSALGLLCTNVVHDYVRSEVSMLHDVDLQRIEAAFAELTDRARDDLQREGLGREQAGFMRELDLRYAGQGYEVRVPVPAGRVTVELKASVAELFHDMHERLRGHRAPAEPVEIVSYRVRAEVSVPQYQPREYSLAGEETPSRPAATAHTGTRAVQFAGEGGPVKTQIWRRDRLRPGDAISGPAVIEQVDATTVLPPAWDCLVDRYGNLRLSHRQQGLVALEGD